MTGTNLKHRLAAILAADAVGYSRLMSADERGTLAALEAARTVFKSHVEQNQGRVIDMAGDSVLAVFDSAAGAVNASLAVQSELDTASAAQPEDRRMRFRIGVHLGDVIEKPDGSVFGDGVNIAARLQAGAPAGGIWVSDAVRGAVKSRLSAAFEDQGEQQMKNLSEPVRAYCVRAAVESEATIAAASKPTPINTEIDLSLPDKPSIAVLPFTNMSGDPEQEYFTDGVTEDIITELSRFHSLFVIARNSSFTYKGKAVDVRTVAKELGVRYVLEGSIRRASNRIRVTAQLIDALSGKHIWAEKYDRVLEDIFVVQEEVTRSIVAAIAPRIEEAESVKVMRKRPDSLTAYEIAVRARVNVNLACAYMDRARLNAGIREAREALRVDPNSAQALNTLAFAMGFALFMGMAGNKQDARKATLETILQALNLDRTSHDVYLARAFMATFERGDDSLDRALDDCRRAHELNPNDFRTYWGLGWVEMLRGQYHRAIEYQMQAIRISPRDPVVWNAMTLLSTIYFLMRDYATGLKWGLRAIGEAPQSHAHQEVALCYVGMGEIGKAVEALRVARQRAPEFIEAALKGRSVLRGQEERRRYTTFLRIAAGLEDPSAADALR